MSIHAVPMLIAGILAGLLSAVTWLFRRRERINRAFSLFTLAVAVDAIAYFAWFQFGSVEHIDIWMRLTFTLGFIVPATLVFFFLAFSGYDQRLDERVLGLRVRYFVGATLAFILMSAATAQFTDLIVAVPDRPAQIYDVEFGALGSLMFLFYGLIFGYLFTLAFKSYRRAETRAERHLVMLLSLGTLIWLMFGYVGALVVPVSSLTWMAISYLGTATMAVFYFVAIVNHQSDQVDELNRDLEQKVERRTAELREKNDELQDTLRQLQQMQQQAIVREKLASLGQLVAGLTHEFNTPLGVMLSMQDVRTRTVQRLRDRLSGTEATPSPAEITGALDRLDRADTMIAQGASRLQSIVASLKNFARLDEAETVEADIHEGLDSVLELIGHDLLSNIDVVRDYGDVAPLLCQPRRLNQVFLNLLKNAAQASDGSGRITITTRDHPEAVRIAIADTGCGIEVDQLETIFDPVFAARGAVVRTRLGLSISRQIVTEHHGRIEVTSEPGHGSVFTIILPREGRV